MHVVTAGVAGVRHGGPVRDVLDVRHGQRVHVGAERDDRALGVGNLLRADVDEQAGPLGQDDRPQARRGQAQRDPAGRPVLVEGQLRMSVQVPAELDELRLVFSQERVGLFGRRFSRHRHGAARGGATRRRGNGCRDCPQHGIRPDLRRAVTGLDRRSYFARSWQDAMPTLVRVNAL